MTERQRDRETETDRDRETETDRDRQRQRQTERQRQRQTFLPNVPLLCYSRVKSFFCVELLL